MTRQATHDDLAQIESFHAPKNLLGQPQPSCLGVGPAHPRQGRGSSLAHACALTPSRWARLRQSEIRPLPSRATACGPLRLLASVRNAQSPSLAQARRRARPGPGSDGLPRCAGCPAVLALASCRMTRFACCAALRSDRMRQARSRSARVRAPTPRLRSSAAPICPAQAALGALPATGSVCAAAHATTASATGHPGRAGRACEAPSSTGFGARARSALRDLTRCVCPTKVSAANGGSYATGPRARAAQGSRSAAKTASPKRRALPGCPVAAPMQAKREFNDSNGPSADLRSRCGRWLRCGSRAARGSD